MNGIATPPRPESAQLDCPQCQTTITYYDVKGSEYYVCPSCHSYFRWSGEEKPKILGQYKKAPAVAPVLPLGTMGTLVGTRYRVVGVMSRHEANHAQYAWREYQLLQPETGRYVQLAEYDGHWTLIWAALEADQQKKKFLLIDFKLFNRYQPATQWALGEFDWDIEGDNRLTVLEYIKPPLLLTQEKSRSGHFWYRGRHVAPQELREGFNLSSEALPVQHGVGAVEPAPGGQHWGTLWRLSGVLAAAMLLLQLFLMLSSGPLVLNQTIGLPPELPAEVPGVPNVGTNRVLVSSSFTLAHQTALDIDLSATVSNQWLELPVSLVNEQTGQGFEFTKNIEFYNGVESGESWSEGSRSANAVLSRVPAGRYHLNFYPITGPGTPPLLKVEVMADPPLPSNFFIVLALLLLLPGLHWLHVHWHERRRWSNSDYSPYATDDD